MDDDHEGKGRVGDSEPGVGSAIAGRLAAAIGDAQRASSDLRVVDEMESTEPTADGTRGYALESDDTRFARVYVYPERVRIEFTVLPDVAASVGGETDLRVRPKAVRPPQTLVFVETLSQVDRALAVVEAVCEALD